MMNLNLSAKKTGAGIRGRAMRKGMACLLAMVCLMSLAAGTNQPAQSGPHMQSERWLLIFDTSSAMKKRLPLLRAEIIQIFATNMSERLHSGDSLAIWTFNTEVHAGQYPLITWDPEAAMTVATNVMKFVEKQDFKGKTQFEVLQPLLSQVIHSSQRLTVLIFTDGEGTIVGTPYDDGINANLKGGASERKKHREPVVVTMRTQEGRFIGATVNYPPTPLNLQVFPPLPETVKETKAAAVQTNVPPPPRVVELPPLIIVGKPPAPNTNKSPMANTITNASAGEVVTNEVANVPTEEETHSNPPSVNEVAESNSVPEPAADTNELAATVKTNLPVLASWANGNQTNSPRAETAPSHGNGLDGSTVALLAVGGGFFGMAVVLVGWLLLRRRAPRTSIITKLMSEDPRFRR